MDEILRSARAWPLFAAVAILIASGLAAKSLAQQAKVSGSSPEAILAYREAANFQNNGAFEIAVEEWQKFVKAHPSDPLAAKAQHYLGVCQLQLKQHAAAAETFDALVKKYPQFELLEDALFNLATSQYALAVAGKKDLYDKSAKAYTTLLDKSPRTKHREDALFYLGEASYALDKKVEAAKAYERLLNEFKTSKRRAEVLYALGVAQEELGNHESAGRTYDTLLREFSSHALASEVRLRKGETLLQAGDLKAAEQLFAKVASVKDFDSIDYALARQAYALARLDRFADAAALYARVATEFPQSTHAADAVLSAGRLFYRANDLKQARAWLERALQRKDASATEASHWLCRLLLKSGEADAAAKLAERELAKAAGPFAVQLQLDLADALYELPASRERAYLLYVEFADKHPQDELASQALYGAAFSALELKRHQDAIKLGDRFLKAFPKNELEADIRYVSAESQLQLKDYAAATRSYRELVDRYASRPEIDTWKLRLGHALLLNKNYDQVVSLLAPQVEKAKSPEMAAEIQYLIGSAQFQAGRFPQAATALSAALAKNAKASFADEALLLLARSQNKTGKNDDAQSSLTKLLSNHADSQVLDEAHYRLAELFDARQSSPEAAKEYEQVIRDYPQSRFVPYSLYGRGWIQYKVKDYGPAANSFTALIDKYANHELAAKSRLGRAMSRRQTGDSRGALADLDAYLKTNLDTAQRSEALYERGLALVSLGDHAAAAQSLESLLKGDPKYAAADRVLYEIGWALNSQDKRQEAAERFARLAKEFPNSPLVAEAWFHVAENEYDQKKYDQAEKAYRAAKSNASGELAEKAGYKLAWTRFQLQDYAGALALFVEQLEKFPQGDLAADAIFMKAECLFRQEKYTEAWPAYEAALQTTASTPTVETLRLLHAGQTASQLKNWEECVKLASRLIERQPNSPLVADAQYEIGWARQNQGKGAEALAAYDEAANKSRDHVGARARFMRGELLFEQKNHADASREFQRAMYGYGGNEATAETKNWQAKSGYEAGRCAEVQLNTAIKLADRQQHLSDARRFYNFVIEQHGNHELAAEAKKRLAVLSKLTDTKTKER